jgi:membrane protein required for colicin V production
MIIDLIFVVVFLYGFWLGYTRGFIGTLFKIAAYTLGFVVAFKLTPLITNVLESGFHSAHPMLFFMAFFISLLLVFLLMRLLGKGITTMVEQVHLGFFNQVVGGTLLAAFSTLLYSVLIWFVVKAQFIQDHTLRDSKSYPVLEHLPYRAKAAATQLKPFFLEFWVTTTRWVERMEQYGGKGGSAPKLIPEDATEDAIERVPNDQSGRPIYLEPENETHSPAQ